MEVQIWLHCEQILVTCSIFYSAICVLEVYLQTHCVRTEQTEKSEVTNDTKQHKL